MADKSAVRILFLIVLKVCTCQTQKDVVVRNVLSHYDENDTEVQKRFERMMHLNDHRTWTGSYLSDASYNCSGDIEDYLKALLNEKTWAIKMFDASGRYNGQFFFGNDFWIGSSSLCQEMEMERLQNMNSTDDIIPPYSIHFSVAKFHLILTNITSQTREIMIGNCLPSSCTSNDLQTILKRSINTIHHSKSIHLDLKYVKLVPGTYNMWNDIKFVIIGGTGAIMVVLMMTASAYELYLIVKKSKRSPDRVEDIEIEYQNNNYTHSHSGGNGNSINAVNGGTVHVNGSGTNRNETVINTNENEQKVKIDKNTRFETGVLSQVLLSFSVISNTEKIMKTEDSTEDSITCIHGLRFLSLSWVILVHTYLQLFPIADNKTLRTIVERNFSYQTVSNASYSVDTFFFISGFLITFLYFKTKFGNYTNKTVSEKKHQDTDIQRSNQENETTTRFTRITCALEFRNGTCEFITLMFYRLIRLTPAYLFVIGVNHMVFLYINNNTVFEIQVFDHINCEKYWWRNILYINNLFPHIEMCMLWSWYMANDTQFYIIGVILILISKRYFKTSTIMMMMIMISSWIVTAYISLDNNYKAKIQEPFEMFDALYDKPWSRVGPYLIGMITGWYVYRCQCKIVIPYWLIIISWPCAMGILTSLVYGIKDGYLERWPTAFYVSVGHTAWGVAIAWIVIYCVAYKDGLLNRLLSYRGILPLSRLAYCAYLVHPMIMVISSFQLDGPFHLHNGIVLVIFGGNLLMSYLMSFAISLAFEAPIMRLLKIRLTNSKR